MRRASVRRGRAVESKRAMSDDSNRRTLGIESVGQRPGGPSRTERIRDLMNQAAEADEQAAAAVPIQRPALTPKAQPTAALFAAARLAAGNRLRGPLRLADDQKAYSQRASAVNLYGARDAEVEATGNPWKVIDCAWMFPVLFSPEAATQQPFVPDQAAQTPHGLLFEVGVGPKGAAEPAQRRAVLVDAQGKLKGAQCHSTDELRRLLPLTVASLCQDAFGEGPSPKFELGAVRQGQHSAFEVEFKRGGSTWVPVNNFGLYAPQGDSARAHFDPARYLRDEFLAR
jgi:hypothetical protein